MRKILISSTVVSAAAILALVTYGAPQQQQSEATVIGMVDNAVQARFDRVLEFTDTEHYAVYRGGDESHPAAEMTVKDTYKRGVGKSYVVLSQRGSGIILKFGLQPLLDNEQKINLPGNVEQSWFISANYEMKLEPDGPADLGGHDCYIFDISAKRKAPNTIDGKMWVDAHDGSLAQIDGIATQNASVFAGATHMMRQYENVDGFSMATHARAESKSALFGRTMVTIDYTDYHLQVGPEHPNARH